MKLWSTLSDSPRSCHLTPQPNLTPQPLPTIERYHQYTLMDIGLSDIAPQVSSLIEVFQIIISAARKLHTLLLDHALYSITNNPPSAALSLADVASPLPLYFANLVGYFNHLSSRVELLFLPTVHLQVPMERAIQVCWECLASIQRVSRFQIQVKKSFAVLKEYSKKVSGICNLLKSIWRVNFVVCKLT